MQSSLRDERRSPYIKVGDLEEIGKIVETNMKDKASGHETYQMNVVFKIFVGLCLMTALSSQVAHSFLGNGHFTSINEEVKKNAARELHHIR
jgi:hypothetical protein